MALSGGSSSFQRPKGVHTILVAKGTSGAINIYISERKLVA
jgi:hypothetical protein